MAIKTETEDTPPKKYKNFNETYRLCAFFLAVAFLYPNRSNRFKRFLTMTTIIVVNFGQVFWFNYYTYICLYRKDIYNFARNMTLFTVMLLFFFKTYYGMYATNIYAYLLEKMSSNLVDANDMDEDCQELYDAHIKEAKFGEWSWVILPIVLSAQFPIYAGILMSIENIQSDDSSRRMVHDMELLFFEHIQDKSPYFELFFAYNCAHCIIIFPNFTGIDGSFCIATTHLRLKLKLMALKVEKAFKYSKNSHELRATLNEAIKDHQDALEFHSQIQRVFGPWLLAVFLLTSSMITFNLYQIYLLKHIEPKYTLFGIVAVLHIFLPCRYASILTKVGETLPDDLYCVDWERWAEPKLTKTLALMINRAQRPVIITGMGIVTFNLELFKSVLQTSYSFFTLITSGNDE